MKYSAGTIILDDSGAETTVLCLRAYSNWDFPKGELEKGEKEITAASIDILTSWPSPVFALWNSAAFIA